MAVDNAKSVKDTRLYGKIMDAAGGVADGKNDIPWMQRTEAMNIQKTKELDDLVIKWRNLSKREQTRSAYMDAAKHYSSKGEYGAALSKFIEAKDYISQVEHQLEANLEITIASIRLGSMSHVKTECKRALQNEAVGVGPQKLESKFKACLGLYNLYNGHWQLAAQNLTQVDWAGMNGFNNILSKRDVGNYGGLASLAACSREQLKRQVVDNVNFQKFLSLCPKTEKLVKGFYNSQYGIVMKCLDELKPDLQLDIYADKNVEALLSDIRGKALVQYFSPYSVVNMHKMAEAFNISVDQLEKEVHEAIVGGHIKAKMDSVGKVMYADKPNDRKAAMGEIEAVGEAYIREAQAMLLRQALTKDECIVRKAKQWADEEDDAPGGLMGALQGGFQRAFGRNKRARAGGQRAQRGPQGR